MATEWDNGILLSQLSDEPSLSEELGNVAAQVAEGPDRPGVVLDFSQVRAVNSSNLAQILRLRQEVELRHGLLKLAGMTDEVWSVMITTGLDKIFRFAPDVMTALAGIQIEMQPSGTPIMGEDEN